ncbi:hypothetical protein K469DRAFT_167189 [Zopfia rhizophila CBS 207.26]|uniref:Uncharacterized protein n=1 Tax=Zopfia rhizophila CBS 207.26 TaxID=1314779 RepID=A0A6A6D563_9PEZI|nr:hypothetical protein K469DRAFT_167189 [Zopfia rhizophila CBS 207.26]
MRLRWVVFVASTRCVDTLDIPRRMGLSSPRCPLGIPGSCQLDLALQEPLPGRRIETGCCQFPTGRCSETYNFQRFS